MCTLGGVRFHLVGSATPGVHSWTIESAGASASELEINGLRCLVRPEGAGGPPAPPSAHPNGATALNKAVILCADTPDTAAKLPIGEPLVLKTNPAPPENDGNTFALWAMNGMSMFEIADLRRPGGAVPEGPDMLGAFFVLVDDLDAAMEVAGGADNFAEPYEYSGRTTAALKGKRFGMSASVLLQGPLLEASKL